MKYKAIFFDWDGTAVESRKSSADKVLKPICGLLEKGVKMVIISGTTYENICSGNLHEKIPSRLLKNLYLGLGRGAYNYGFKNGEPVILQSMVPLKEELLLIHKICFEIHKYLYENYNLETDIVFSRPNYCKIDIMPKSDRGDKLFLQIDEIDIVENILLKHGFNDGLKGLIRLAEKIGSSINKTIKATTDAKYLEVGISTKSDNVDYFIKRFEKLGINPLECAFFGDEFTYLADGIKGSDAFMITELTKNCDFYDVSQEPLKLPDNVKSIGSGTLGFYNFLQNFLIN